MLKIQRSFKQWLLAHVTESDTAAEKLEHSQSKRALALKAEYAQLQQREQELYCAAMDELLQAGAGQ